jgi:hypothetical protein
MKQFVMGAALRLQDNFTGVVRQAVRSSNQLRATVGKADRATLNWRDSTGRLRNEMGRYVGATKRANTSTRMFINSNGQLSASLGMIRQGIAAAVVGLGLFGAKRWLIDSNADMETYKNTLTVVLGSQEKAIEQLKWAEKFAAKTPFEIPQIIEATTRMEAYGIKSQKTLGIVGDMASVMGKDLMQAVEAVADAQTGELERLKEFGITKKMIEEQAKLLGTAPVNSKGQITDVKAFNAALFALMEKRFKGGMEMQSKSFKGMVSNVKDFMGQMGKRLGAPLFEKTKAGLGDFLGFLNRLQESGAIDTFIQRTQRLGAIVGRVFSYAFGIAQRNVLMIAGKLQAFYTENQAAIRKIGTAFVAAFQLLRDWSMPIINWIYNTGLPLIVDALTEVGGWVVKTAEWFIDNWKDVRPFVIGIAAAWGTYLAVTKAWALATKIATAVQWALNIAMNANPIGLIITGIGLLIGAIVWLTVNWEKVKTSILGVWRRLGDFRLALLAILGPIGGLIGAGIAVYKNWDKIRESAGLLMVGVRAAWNLLTGWVTGKMDDAKAWGANIIKTMLDGILGMKDKLVEGVKSVFAKVREYMPFSDAKKGPFSQLTYSGGAIISTMGRGVQEQASQLTKAVGRAFSNTGLEISPNRVQAATGATASAGATYNFSSLVGAIHVHAGEGADATGLVDDILAELYRRAKDAAGILSSEDMGELL